MRDYVAEQLDERFSCRTLSVEEKAQTIHVEEIAVSFEICITYIGGTGQPQDVTGLQLVDIVADEGLGV